MNHPVYFKTLCTAVQARQIHAIQKLDYIKNKSLYIYIYIYIVDKKRENNLKRFNFIQELYLFTTDIIELNLEDALMNIHYLQTISYPTKFSVEISERGIQLLNTAPLHVSAK